MNKTVSSLLYAVRDFILPDICCICSEPVASFIDKSKIYFNIFGKKIKSPYCKSCTESLEKATVNMRAVSKDLKLNTYFVFDYSHHSVKHSLYHIKSTNCKKCRQFYADIVSFLCEKHCEKDTVITYIPRNRQNLKKYGFDQSERILNAFISSHPDKNYTALFERKHTLYENIQQKTLDHNSRAENARRSIILKKDVNIPKNVLLFDDMVTTGATFTAASELLYNAGTEKVKAIAISATIKEN